MRPDLAAWWDDLLDAQEKRIRRKTAPILQRAKQRRQAQLRDAYAVMDADRRLACHASGPRRPDMDHQ